MTLAVELGDVRRFAHPSGLMKFIGLTPTEQSSGNKRRTGGISRSGTTILRRLLIEGAWTYRFPPKETKHIQQKAARASEYARQRSWQAQKVLNQKYQRLHIRGKHHNQVIAAVARSLVGYIWDIGCHTMEAIDNPQPQHERFQ